MSRKIEIPPEVLEDLYSTQKLSTYQISKKFNCNPSVIQKRLKKGGIKLRNPKHKIEISKEYLFDTYVHKKLSTQKISKLLDISSCSVYYKLKEFGINPRKKNLLLISKENLKKLYTDQNLSCSTIAEKFNCNAVTIFNRLKKYNIKTRNYSLASTKYPKRTFNGDNKLKAYMIGFRLGDLNIKAKNPKWTIILKSNTTRKEQVDLIRQVYGKYGHFNLKEYTGVYHIFCNLDKSFNFLLKKEDKIEEWIFTNKELFLSFLGGYSDAEGNFGIYSNRARFRVGSYDKQILKQIAERLNSFGIITKFNLESRAIPDKQNKDFYRVSINEKASLLKFIQLIRPFIKHKKRYNDLLNCKKNILERNKSMKKSR